MAYSFKHWQKKSPNYASIFFSAPLQLTLFNVNNIKTVQVWMFVNPAPVQTQSGLNKRCLSNKQGAQDSIPVSEFIKRNTKYQWFKRYKVSLSNLSWVNPLPRQSDKGSLKNKINPTSQTLLEFRLVRLVKCPNDLLTNNLLGCNFTQGEDTLTHQLY